MRRKILGEIIFLIFSSLCAYGQQATLSNKRQVAPVDNAIALYNQFTDGAAPIYNGREYLGYNFRSETIPFFESATFNPGAVHYAGRWYRNLPLQYDISRNQIILLGPHNIRRIVLQNTKVDSFNLLNHLFIKIQPDSALYKGLSGGYYDVLYSGQTKILVSREKDLEESTSDRQLVYTFHNKNRFYLLKGGNYHYINSKKDLLNLFSDHKHQVRKYMRKHKIRFHKAPENAIVQTAALYDRLSH